MFRLKIVEINEIIYAGRQRIKMCAFNNIRHEYYLEMIDTSLILSIYKNDFVSNEITEHISDLTINEESRICSFSYKYSDFRDIPYIIESVN